MKKIALFAAAMLVCVGFTFAQNPVKKTSNDKAKTEQVQTVKADKPAPQASQAATQAAPTQKAGCGSCPHHKQCNKSAQPTAKPEAEKACCDKKATEKTAPKKGGKTDAAVTK